MTGSSLITIAFGVQIALLLAIGVQFRGRLHMGEDFTLGRRRLSLPFSAAALAMNSVPMWWLVMLMGVAFTVGVAAIWLALALLGGVLIGGWHLAPRLRALTNIQQRGTFSELLVVDAGDRMRNLLIRSALLIITTTLLFATVAQLQLSAQFLFTMFELSNVAVIVAIGIALCFSFMLAGIWAAAAIDTWQIIVTFAVFLVAVGALCVAMFSTATPITALWHGDWFADQTGLLKVSFTLGVAFVSGDIFGQVPLLARYMACSSDAELARARFYSFFCSAAALFLAVLIGLSARALSTSATANVANLTASLSKSISAEAASVLMLVIVGAATAAIGTNTHSIASHLANDLKRGGVPVSLARCRVALMATVIVAVVIACNLPMSAAQKNFDRLMFCWHALGAAFGPLLIVRLSGKRVRPGSSLGSMWSGFLLTVVFYLMPDTPGELLERGLPFAAALGIALSGGERRRNPDRADRGERTVHDRLPI